MRSTQGDLIRLGPNRADGLDPHLPGMRHAGAGHARPVPDRFPIRSDWVDLIGRECAFPEDEVHPGGPDPTRPEPSGWARPAPAGHAARWRWARTPGSRSVPDQVRLGGPDRSRV